MDDGAGRVDSESTLEPASIKVDTLCVILCVEEIVVVLVNEEPKLEAADVGNACKQASHAVE